MIHYHLTCEKGHRFGSWFKSAEAFDSLALASQVTCALCGSAQVKKALMAPSVRTAPAPEEGVLSQPASDLEKAIAEFRRQISENSEYVGMGFAAEARAIHEGEKPSRPIYGEAKPAEARALLEDGIPVAPLPFMPPRKTN